MNTLVTGAGGFLGLYITEQLIARGDQVRSFSRGLYAALEALGVETIRGDLRDRDAVIAACEGVDCVFHAAGVAGIWGPWDYYHGINTLGTSHIIEGCRRHGVGRLVYTSSPSVTFDGSPQHGIDESAPYPTRWLCHYPHSKALAEQAVLAANSSNLLTCALRPHLIWGPRDNQLVPRLLTRARAGRLRRVGDGANLVDIIYVENAAYAHLLAANALTSAGAPPGGKAYFLSQAEPVRCWDWINEILTLAGLRPVTKAISTKAAWRLGAALEGVYRTFRIQQEPPMTRFLATQLGTSHYFHGAAARQELGYHARISTEEGMGRLATWLDQQAETMSYPPPAVFEATGRD